ncbi:helix-turn-helix domain-containing protein [Tenuibacillus multivorans]|uniref:DNA-binding transcriptional regulator, XRE-family HTH domain n=1 Tax=Tenuibacillus multivorans TaxID=237069 RepID=A0A1H0EEF9_9BACI|nr:helix-turn-helix transcriptional regulator [Tenuibacillus multivorans]GEL77191.1 transcriptional regulator [Tenuibacillus multivorans]SDN80752.1 DNA-binding transcriptional regulator, XRE-family HTH domain [Tenuibacillus multivorans]
MAFGEKLHKLRKEKGLSQEALAEKLNTTRQAISKWENGQGFPETEKLLMIGNIFEVSMDYLLKDSAEQSHEREEGYYVSREMAEGYLSSVHKSTKYGALGASLLILSAVPYFVFDQDPGIYTFLILILAAIGIMALVSADFAEEDQYKILKREPLILDENYLKELTTRYEDLKKRYTAVMAIGIGSFVVAMVAFVLERKDIALGALVPYYAIFVALLAVGTYILIRTSSILEAYKLLVKNEAYINSFGFKLRNKVRKKVDNL